ncbi:hypothetical protein [Desulfosporosinus sp. Sb-LF]|uniref:hypothetical protein n=1 Tax=Desulfosporosinus sp. Sb-LF TaxID=2560027 RepID=UPI001101A99B|nr:hypothetical protein [Desulfosporosinus sp. Sb-LF]TGE32533.1 hypothetical protein E4K68_10095 [Desulfosporosinus sp. Sb-LF]
MDGTFHVHRLRAGRGVGRLDGSLLGCLRKDVALCHTASWAWVGRTWGDEGRTGDGPFGWTAHFMSTVCVQVVVSDRLDGSLLGCLRKDVALCHTACWAWVGGTQGTDGDEPFGWTAHFMCIVWRNNLSKMILDKGNFQW